MISKSPSGSTCPYYYMGGELHPLKYGCFHKDKQSLFDIIKAEEEFILRSSGTANRHIWIDLYETELDDESITVLVSHLKTIRHKINRLCLVGCNAKTKRKIKAEMKREQMDLADSTPYFSDPEQAKQWLVSE